MSTLPTACATAKFVQQFHSITENEPYPWQVALFQSFMNGQLPASCDIPTGLGKTKIILIWWLARLAGGPVNRRLAYVVNRRTIVDQATTEAEAIAEKFPELMISTVRGQRLDNKNWRENPEKPAIIIGTPDMVASKLLFGGYGDGDYNRPIHAGILGNDTLFVVDEAHLSVPLCQTIGQIRDWQNQEANPNTGFHPINLVELTATPTTPGGTALGLTSNDYTNKRVTTLLDAPKQASIETSHDITGTIRKLAAAHDGSASRVLVYVHTVAGAIKTYDALLAKYGADRVALLTGTLRGYERDQLLVNNPVVKQFLPPSDSKSPSPEQTVWLVSTSAGEVGWDIDADHLVCDLTPIDSMIQRLGRVNRRGDTTRPHTVKIVTSIKDDPSDYGQACAATRELIATAWNNQSLSPKFLSGWVNGLAPGQYEAAASPRATPVPLHPFALDSWTLTSIQDDLPYKPALSGYIHGRNDQEPETYLIWRSELDDVHRGGLEPKDWLKACRMQAQEMLRGRASVIEAELAELAKTHGEQPVAVIDSKYQSKWMTLHGLTKLPNLHYHTIILPTSIGGLERGLLKAGCTDQVDDVADLGLAAPRQSFIVRQSDESCTIQGRPFQTSTTVAGPKRRAIQHLAHANGLTVIKEAPFPDETGASLVVLAARSDEAPTATLKQPTVDDHNAAVATEARQLATALGMAPDVVVTLTWAGLQHDLGKTEEIWQQFIGNFDPSIKYAKSGTRGGSWELLNGYRHELGSLVQAGQIQSPAMVDRDLALYLIGAHHGHGRPHFPVNATGGLPSVNIPPDVAERFARLQHRYGRWGLAWLHAIMCIADHRGS